MFRSFGAYLSRVFEQICSQVLGKYVHQLRANMFTGFGQIGSQVQGKYVHKFRAKYVHKFGANKFTR